MKLEDQVCSLELAKKLDELGVDKEFQKAAAFWYWYKDDHTGEWDIAWYQSDELIKTNERVYPALSVAELGEMLPKSLHVGIYMHELTIIRSSVWRFYYGVDTAGSVYFTAGNDDTEADARAKMLIYLIENKLISKA
jgi:hypothetical protein